DDVVISDELNHASIIDGARLSRATIKVFPHRDVDAARAILKTLPASQRKLLITDGVFSMEGDLGPLPELCAVAEEFGCIMTVDVVLQEPQISDRLWANTRFFKACLQTLGFNTGISESPITPLIVGDGARAMQLSDQLFAAGVFAQGIAYPTVARDKARVRTIVTAAHTPADLAEALNIFESVGRAMGLI